MLEKKSVSPVNVEKARGMAAVQAVRYREKARQLFEDATSAANEHLREEFTSSARRYEHLAATLESMSAP
jgi:hypothetical protein